MDHIELLQVIKQAARDRVTSLDLSKRQLTALPPEVAQLTNLTALDLSGNQLTALPPEVAQLTSLTSLDLGGNRLTALPPEVTQLTSLTSLDLGRNQLTALPPEVAQLTNLTALFLNNNQLTALPPEVTQLTSLTSLDLSRNQLTALPPEVTQLTNLTALDLGGNQLTALPPEVTQLTSLTALDLSDNQLTALPPEVAQLTNLTALDLSGNQLTALPPEVAQLTSLTSLDLGGNRLTALPPEVAQLANLTSLFLNNNQLTALPPEVAQLTNLIRLDLSDNRLTALPPEVAQLANLTSLFLNNNQLTALPPEVTQLTNLTALFLDNNQLTALPPEVAQLTNLIRLDLNNNQLTALPPEVAQLTNLTALDLSGNQLTALPPEVAQLTSLTSLDLGGNRLTALPPEVTQLTSLTSLDLGRNQLTALPPEVAQLTNLTALFLNNNQLTALPPEVTQLTNLIRLDLSDNRLTALPPEVAQLANLTSLFLNNNQLTALPPEVTQLTNLTALFLDNNQLTALPPEVAQLTNLIRLDLNNNQLTALPPEVAQLTNLTALFLDNNQLTALPPEVAQLTNLIRLDLSDNRLTALPPEVAQLANLTSLFLNNNQLTALPPEVTQLTNLTALFLNNNQLTALPPEVAQLTNLIRLDLNNNQLTALPPEVAQLTNLTALSLDNNQLTAPPPEIVTQGTQAILVYLRERLESSSRQWASKLLVVGEGGVGKTSMLRALKGEPFSAQESTTRGIDIHPVEIPHPADANITMQLSIWDFGGQEIYHAIHQFFLTNRSLFLLAWNARLGFEQGKLYYWLDRIQALAPDSPVLLVATWTDERDADLPLADLRRKYPQIIGQCEISNLTGKGIDQLRQEIATAASRLPLMGELWPTTWLNAANAVRARPEKYISPRQMWDMMAEHGVAETSAVVLARWLHELGDILYFKDSEELRDIVVLKPQWVTQYISKVLDSEEVKEKFGVYTREHMNTLWYDIDPAIHDHFLRLMERFDLSYQTLENKEISLIVERLPMDQPDYSQLWESPKASGDCHEVSMKFRLNTIPAGIPTWFIARSHRFTTHTHWRSGAVLAYEKPEPKHLALVQSFPHERYLQLTVRGPNPQNFFALLKDGIEVTLARFPGLQIMRLIPCPGHDGGSCSHEFDYEQLLKRIQKKPAIECPESLEDVTVTELLFGLHWSTQDAVLSRLDELEAAEIERHEETLSALENLRALVQREFANAFRREQAKLESHCPNVFTLRSGDDPGQQKKLQRARKVIAGQKTVLQLFCQAPGCWHPTVVGGLYSIDEPAKWMRTTAPYLRRLVAVLKYAAPLIGPWLGVAIPNDYEKYFKNSIKLTEELVKKIPELKKDDTEADLAEAIDAATDMEMAEGAALRSLRQLLDQKDPQQHWGGLKKVLTPEGHYLWLCDYHAQEYVR